jgi:hypothetical protein
MYRKGLEWAEQLRGDLVIRIEDLRAALADVEPLRLELERLQSQLKGVERLIAIHHAQLGLTVPAWVGEPLESGGAAAHLQSSAVPAENTSAAAMEAAYAPLPVYDPPMSQGAPREKRFRFTSYAGIVAGHLSQLKLRSVRLLELIRDTSQARVVSNHLVQLRLWFVRRFLHPSA